MRIQDSCWRYTPRTDAWRIVGIVISLSLAILFAATDSARAANSDGAETGVGRQLFLQNCARCHGSEGEGRGFDFPALNNSQRLSGDDSGETIAWILTGNRARPGFVTDSSYEMPGFEGLSDEDIAIVARYVRCRFAARCDAIEPAEVRAVRETVAATP